MTTYYVDTAADAGGDGTTSDLTGPNCAFKTLAQVNAATLAGDDIVQLKKGCRWYEKLVMGENGTSGHPITFTNYGSGDKPIIIGGGLIPAGDWVSEGSNIYSYAVWDCNGILEDDISLPQASSTALTDGMWFRDGAGKIWYKHGTYDPRTDAKTLARLVFDSTVDCTVNSETAYITFNDIHLIGEGFFNGSGRTITEMVISSCDFSDCRTAIGGLTAGGGDSSITIRDCTFTRCGVSNYLMISGSYKWTVTIQRNTYRAVNRTGFSPSDFDHVWLKAGTGRDSGDRGGIQLQNIQNSLIEHNEIGGDNSVCDTDGGIVADFQAGGAGTGNIIRYNTIHDIEGQGLSSGAVDDCQVKFHYNLVYNVGSGKAGIQINGESPSSAPSEIYNNTFYNCQTSIKLLSGPCDYTKVKNNISLSPTKYHISCENSAGILNNIADYNCYYPLTVNGSKPFYADTGDPWPDLSFAEWKVATGQDANSITSDPLVVSTTDFHLQSGSPCIDRGVNLGINQDLDGNAVPQ